MKNYFQWFINALVITIVLVSILPYLGLLLPYDDVTTPDETIALDIEVTAELENIEANFLRLYESRALAGPYNLTYLPESKQPISDQENYQKAIDSIVYITTVDDIGQQYFGTGTILDDEGLILTNFHVIDGAVKVLVSTTAGDHYPVTSVIASDESMDIAFITIGVSNLVPLPIGDSDAVRVGDKTLAIGHPENLINSLSIGNIAGIRSFVSQGVGTNFQITNPISMGNSGGAVINEYGEIIAVPTWSIEYNDNSVQVQNLNFAVPINEALKLLEDI